MSVMLRSVITGHGKRSGHGPLDMAALFLLCCLPLLKASVSASNLGRDGSLRLRGQSELLGAGKGSAAIHRKQYSESDAGVTVHLIISNHLDVGYTDLDIGVINLYINEFIPRAVSKI